MNLNFIENFVFIQKKLSISSLLWLANLIKRLEWNVSDENIKKKKTRVKIGYLKFA